VGFLILERRAQMSHDKTNVANGQTDVGQQCEEGADLIHLATWAVKQNKCFERGIYSQKLNECLFGTIPDNIDNGLSKRAGRVCAQGCGDGNQRLSLGTS
jgi:hypothetical protein